jgi:cell division protein FtsB
MHKPKSSKERIYEKIIQNSKYLLLALALLLAISLFRNITKTIEIKKRIAKERLALSQLVEKKEELTRKLAESQSQEFLEEQLRNKLGLSKEGEIVVVLPDTETLKQIAPAVPVEKEVLPPPTWQKWLRLFI